MFCIDPSSLWKKLLKSFMHVHCTSTLLESIPAGPHIGHGCVLPEGQHASAEVPRGEGEEEGAGQALGAGRHQDGKHPRHQGQGRQGGEGRESQTGVGRGRQTG